MSVQEQTRELERVPAIIYSVLWQTREMNFLGRIMKEVNVESLDILIYFEDYQPGALIKLRQEEGDFSIHPISSLEELEYDGAIIGKLRPIIKAFEGNLLVRVFWSYITRKIKLKGKLKLWKFLKIVMRCAF